MDGNKHCILAVFANVELSFVVGKFGLVLCKCTLKALAAGLLVSLNVTASRASLVIPSNRVPGVAMIYSPPVDM